MFIEIELGAEKTGVDLSDGLVKIGGAETDDIFIPGLPPRLLELTIEGGIMQAICDKSLRIGGALFPTGVARRVLEGEKIELAEGTFISRAPDAQRRDSRRLMGTAFVAKELLSSGDVPIENTRAASFTCVTGLDVGRVFAVAFDENSLGRADDANIRIRDRAVSRQHAVVTRHGRHLGIAPLGAMNGVYLNGKAISKETLLKSGDVIEVGQTVLRYDAAESAPEEKTVLEMTPEPKPIPLPEVAPQDVEESVTLRSPPNEMEHMSKQTKSIPIGARWSRLLLWILFPALSLFGAGCAFWLLK
jgi:pSer/pThr/pTyr-binding forkhead associated (FHA) protein